MARSGSNGALMAVALTAVVAVNALLLDGALGHWLAGTTGRILAPAAGRMAWVKEYGGGLFGRFDLAAQRIRLDGQERMLQAQLAQIDELRTELAFYRAAAGLRERSGREPVRAGAFSWPRVGGTRELAVNRGSDDWVAVGDVVTTGEGAIIGIVRDAYPSHAVATALGDAGLEITARVVGTEVSGLVRADDDGLLLDLVQAGEAVTEGQTIVTGGNDRFPPGLVIGTVRSVDHEAATLFIPVRISPAAAQPYAGPVIIIRP